MILTQKSREIISNADASKEFTIKNSAKAFKILSAGLYSDKIKAIVRELSCNAWDAHVMAKNKKPFHVHLPNKLEPWFSVRDYGIGLSEEDIMNLYSTYFESTKTKSNDQIGALGLGSKSPFSYTDSFNIVSIFNGERKTYTAYINETGTPSITKTFKESVENYLAKLEGNFDKKKEAHNGLEVRFSVNANDFDDFARKAAQVFRIFKVKPEVGGSIHYSNYEHTLTTIIAGKGWRFMKTNFYENDRAVALQGNVEYPIDKNQLGDLTKEQEFIADGKFYIDFKIGELDISASRESLGYDESTIKNIKEALTRVYKSLHRMLNKKIKDADTLFNAHILASKIIREVGFDIQLSKSMVFKWQDKKFILSEGFEYVFSEESDWNPITESGTGTGIKDRTLKIEYFRRESWHRSNRISSRGIYEADAARKIKFVLRPDQLENNIFVVRDETEEEMTTFKVRRKVKQIARNNAGKTVFFLNEMSEAFFNAMGNPTYMVTSDIKLEVNSRSSNNTIKYPNNYFHMKEQDRDVWYTYNCSYDDLAEKCDGDLSGHYFITRIRNKYFDSYGKEVNISRIRKLFNFLKAEGIIAERVQIFGIKNTEKSYKRWKKLGWTEFTAAGNVLFQKYVNDNINTFKKPLIAKKVFDKIESQVSYQMKERLKSEIDKITDYPEGSNFANIINTYAEAKAKKNEVDDELRKIDVIVKISNNMNINIERFFDVDVTKFDIKAMYPMMSFISNWDLNNDNNWAKIKAYIIMVDKEKNL